MRRASITCGELAELVEQEVAVSGQRQLVCLELVALRLNDHVAHLLLVPQPVHAVHDPPTALQVLRVHRLVAAAGHPAPAQVAAEGASAGAGAAAVGEAGPARRHPGRARRPRLPLPVLAAVGARHAAGAVRVAVHRRHARPAGAHLAVERAHVGAVQLPDDLVAWRRAGRAAASSTDTAHRRRQLPPSVRTSPDTVAASAARVSPDRQRSRVDSLPPGPSCAKEDDWS